MGSEGTSKDGVERRWRVREYAPKEAGLRGATVRTWVGELVGPQPSNHQYLLPVSEHEAITQKLREERDDQRHRAEQAERLLRIERNDRG